MGIIADLTPVYYRLMRIGVVRSDGDVLAIADLQILNNDSRVLCMHNPTTMLTIQEKQALAGFVEREMIAFEVATGLVEWVEPEEE